MRSLNLDQLRAFVEVVARGSFTAAARELNLTQPAVTHQVQELERRFKVTLVERFGKRAYLTQAGEKLIEHARNLLEEDSRTQVMMRRFGDGWLGRVRVGTSMTVLMYLLPPILRQLKTDYPQLEINLKAGLTATTLQMLKTNALDLGLCALPIEDPTFETIPLLKDELVAILPAGTERVPKRVTPTFLSRCPLILGSEKSALRRTVTDWLALAGSPPKPLMEFDNVEAMKSVVAVGLGASIVPSVSLGAGHIPATNMIVRPLNPRASRRVGLVRLSGKRATEGMELVSAALLSLRCQGGAKSFFNGIDPDRTQTG
jgi:DNA-binding transcriptional LysR family regulator